jgi:F0F1-type ATP synthase delta subunit
MIVRDYINAAYELLEKDEKDTLPRLKQYLEKKGLMKLYPRILRGLMEKIRRNETSGVPKVILARENDGAAYKNEIHGALQKMGMQNYDVVVDDSIIGGFIVKGKTLQVDGSYKRTLLEAYHRLTE